MIEPHLPILVILLPLLAAPVLVCLGSQRVAHPLACIVTWLTFGAVTWLASIVAKDGVVRYAIGGWQPPYGIEYVADPLSSYVLTFLSFVAAIVLTASGRLLGDEVRSTNLSLFYAAYLLCLAGLMGMCVTGDLFNVFVFLEISSLSTYALIALGRTRRAPLAALRYLIIGTIGATFFLIGIGLLFQMTGTLNMADLADRLPRQSGSRTLSVALAIMAVGLAIKMAVFPLHTWLPDAYAEAPHSVTAFIAATSTKVSVYAFIRLIYTIFTDGFAFDLLPLDSELQILSLFGIYAASLAAIFQSDVKRLLAYSSVAQIGYMLLGVSLNDPVGLAGGIVHLMNHAFIKGGLFLAVAIVAARVGGTTLEHFRGVGRSMPGVATAMAVGLVALIGVPLTSGFVTKWLLLESAIRQNNLVVAGLMLISSLLAVVYSWKVIEAMFFSEPSRDETVVIERGSRIHSLPMATAGLWALVGLSVVLGVWTAANAQSARTAASYLLDAAP